MSTFFVELSLVMIITFVIAYLVDKIKQPLLVGYIIAGIVSGPLFLNVLGSSEGYETFSHIGVALLLFIVGLHLNLRLIKDVGTISAITGIGQVMFTATIGFGIGTLLGFDPMAAFLLAICLTFSSTIIIVKLLSDKKDLHKLYGKIAMGFLIVQDFIAVILLMTISSLLTVDVISVQSILFQTLSFGVFSFVVAYFLAKYVVPTFLPFIVRSQELLFLFVITWCFGLAALFDFYGFSLEIGALIAGLTLASTPYQYEISAKVRPLRDFFIVMFFILLGSQMLPDLVNHQTIGERYEYFGDNMTTLILPAIIFSLFVLIGNPMIVLFLMTRLGYSLKTSFLAGLTVAQISEFSLILALLGQQAGFLSSNEVSMLTFVGIFTITGSTYMIMHGDYLYKLVKPYLRRFEKKELRDAKEKVKDLDYDILIFGYGEVGDSLVRTFERTHRSYLFVDFDPTVVANLQEKGIPCLYGDADDINLLEELNFENVQLLISTMSDFETNTLLMNEINKRNKTAHKILTSNDPEKALILYDEGADYVILPHYISGNFASNMIEKYDGNFEKILDEKILHMNDLKLKREVLQKKKKVKKKNAK